MLLTGVHVSEETLLFASHPSPKVVGDVALTITDSSLRKSSHRQFTGPILRSGCGASPHPAWCSSFLHTLHLTAVCTLVLLITRSTTVCGFQFGMPSEDKRSETSALLTKHCVPTTGPNPLDVLFPEWLSQAPESGHCARFQQHKVVLVLKMCTSSVAAVTGGDGCFPTTQ